MKVRFFFCVKSVRADFFIFLFDQTLHYSKNKSIFCNHKLVISRDKSLFVFSRPPRCFANVSYVKYGNVNGSSNFIRMALWLTISTPMSIKYQRNSFEFVSPCNYLHNKLLLNSPLFKHSNSFFGV